MNFTKYLNRNTLPMNLFFTMSSLVFAPHVVFWHKLYFSKKSMAYIYGEQTPFTK